MDAPNLALPTRERDKIQAFEGLRAIMAWWVVLGHISHTIGWNLALLDHNALAVDVFIILSGFVIYRLIDVKDEAYGPYIARRAFRIFPLYLTVLAISSVCLPLFADAMANIPFQTIRNADRATQAGVALDHFLPHLLIHLPLLQGLVPANWLPGAAYTIVGQAWSISLEWQFYLAAPIVAGVMTRGSLAARLAGILAVVALYLLPGMTGAFLGTKIFYFAVGIGSYIFFRDGPRTNGWVAGGVFAAVIAIGARDGLVAAIPLSIWFVTLGSVMGRDRTHGLLARALGASWLVWLGQRSYSTYLIHMLPLYLGCYALNQMSLSTLGYSLALVLIVLLVTLLASVLSFSFIERPGIAVGTRVARRVSLIHSTRVRSELSAPRP